MKILTELSLCYSTVYHYNGAQWYESSYRLVHWILLGLSLSSEHLYIFSLHGAIYILKYFFTLLYLLVTWAWWNWPLTRPGGLNILYQCYDCWLVATISITALNDNGQSIRSRANPAGSAH